MKKHIISAAAVVSAFAIVLCGCSESNKPVSDITDASAPSEAVQPFNDYFNGFLTNDGEKVILSTMPQTFIDEMKKTDKYDDFLAQTQDSLIPVTINAWSEKYGDNITVTFLEQVSSTQLSADTLDLAELCYKYTYYDVNADVEITEGYEVTYRYEIKGSASTTEGEETACFVRVKDDSWKMISTKAETLEQYRDAEDPYNSTQA